MVTPNPCPNQGNKQLKLQEEEEEKEGIYQVNDGKNVRRNREEVRKHIDLFFFITEVRAVQETER